MRNPYAFFTLAVLSAALTYGPADVARAQTATGALTASFTNSSALIMVFNTDGSGMTLGNAGTSAVTMGFGTVADYNSAVAAGATLTSGSTSFTVSSPFDVYVEVGGSASASYTLAAALASSAPTGVTVNLDSTKLTTTKQTLSTTGTYFSNVAHTVSLNILTSPSGSGGPTTGTQFTSTIDFTATAN